jgi:hypothetical protein
MIRNEFFDGAIKRKKVTETLHHPLRAMMQFPVIFISGDTPPPNKKINSFLNTYYIRFILYIYF